MAKSRQIFPDPLVVVTPKFNLIDGDHYTGSGNTLGTMEQNRVIGLI